MRILLDGTQVGGSKYTSPPVVSISTSPSGLSTANATAVAVVSAAGTVSDVRLTNAGFGYATAPVITIANPNTGVGTGNFFLNEIVKGQSSPVSYTHLTLPTTPYV